MTTEINNVDATNGELGLSKTGGGDDAKYPEGVIKLITCTLIEKKIGKYEIQVEESSGTHTATQTKTKEAIK